MSNEPDQNETGDPSRAARVAKKSSMVRDYATVESMVQLALALPAGCLIGWFAGDALDSHFHTTWMGVAGILLGAVAGFIQIFATAAKYMKRGGD